MKTRLDRRRSVCVRFLDASAKAGLSIDVFNGACGSSICCSGSLTSRLNNLFFCLFIVKQLLKGGRLDKELDELVAADVDGIASLSEWLCGILKVGVDDFWSQLLLQLVLRRLHKHEVRLADIGSVQVSAAVSTIVCGGGLVCCEVVCTAENILPSLSFKSKFCDAVLIGPDTKFDRDLMGDCSVSIALVLEVVGIALAVEEVEALLSLKSIAVVVSVKVFVIVEQALLDCFSFLIGAAVSKVCCNLRLDPLADCFRLLLEIFCLRKFCCD